MIQTKEKLPDYLAQPTKLGEEISITGKWIPSKKGGLFRKSAESREMLEEWELIHNEAKIHEGVLSTEINHAVGQDAVLVHHVFKNSDSVLNYFSTTASDHAKILTKIAKAEIHLVRGVKISDEIREAIENKGVKGAYGEFLFGFVKNEYQRPDPKKAIQVTAKWTCKEGESVEDLIYWWQKVGTDAYHLEEGLIRYEVYRVIGENALIIHETFQDTKVLQYHLTKGTAEIYKKDIDKVAYPENYFFRGPVSWTIRTYSKFMKLPATYSSQGSNFTKEGGNHSDGLI